MHILRLALVLLHSLALVEASVKWTLHSSCYKTGDENGEDKELEEAMISVVSTSKAWAARGSEKLRESLKNKGLFRLTDAVRTAMNPLFDKDGEYEENANDVIAKFDKLAELEGPIGQTADGKGRYEDSQAWFDLAHKDTENTHYRNFVILCRPTFTYKKVPNYPGLLPYDAVRDKQYLNLESPLLKMLQQEADREIGGDWKNIKEDSVQAHVSTDAYHDGDRLHVPESITFHPLWIKYQRDQKFTPWTTELFDEVTASDAAEKFKTRGTGSGIQAVPVDALLNRSLVRNMFHEFFHLSAFGNMIDPRDGYHWVNNVNQQDHENPDFFAIIATVIELLFRDGKTYRVDADGTVHRRRLH